MLKQILSFPIFKTLFSAVFLKLLITTAFFIGLAYLAYRLYKKKKDITPPQSNEEQLASNALRALWVQFTKSIPKEFRSIVLKYQHYISLGDSQSGKTEAINSFTDWESRAYQFHPGALSHPFLQIYIGAKEIVHEIPFSILNEKSPQTKSALLNLWKPLYHKQTPIVLIHLNINSLAKQSPEQIKHHAKIIRGKLSLLSWIRKTPIPTQLVLTHMDNIPGYTEFALFLQNQHIPLKFEFNEKLQLQDSIDKYENYLSIALTSSSSEDYLKILSFFKSVHQWTSNVHYFAQLLQQKDQITYLPQLEAVYLIDSTNPKSITNPFYNQNEETIEEKKPTLFKHQIIAACIALFGLLYLFSIFFEEQATYKEVQNVVASFEKYQSLRPLNNAINSIDTFAQREGYDSSLFFLPRFFSGANKSIGNRFASSVRNYILAPLLNKTINSEYQPEKTLYILALMYATNTNQLGKLIDDNAKIWAQRLGLQESLIKTYLDLSTTPWDYTLPLDELPRSKSNSPETNFQSWMVYFEQMNSNKKKDFMLKDSIEIAQAKATEFLKIIDDQKRYDFSLIISKLLEQETEIDIQRIYSDRQRVAEWISENRDELEQLFLCIVNTNYPTVTETSLTLDSLITNLKAIMALKPEEDHTFTISLSREKFTFNSRKWHTTVTNSAMYNFIQEFIGNKENLPERLFFSNPQIFPSIEMNPYNSNPLFFTGKGKIEGIYTRAAFDKKVKPYVENISEFLETLKIQKTTLDSLSKFIQQQINDYASNYYQAYYTYYKEFSLEASSEEQLQIILSQILRSNSPLFDFLQTCHDNLVFDIGKSPYLRPMSKWLNSFQFLQTIFKDNKGSYPEWDKYKEILQQIQARLTHPAAYQNISQNKNKDLDDLQAQLTPLANMSLAILKQSPDSYLLLTQQWLGSLGITSEYSKPFVEPFLLIEKFGKKELQKIIEKLWEYTFLPQLQPVISKFPFSPKATEDVSTKDLEQILQPKGKFWTLFNELIAPVSQKNKDKWEPLTSENVSINLPTSFYKTINQLQTITQALWDKDGKPKPLNFDIKTIPLPKSETENQSLLLAFINTGNLSLFNFNQRPSWKNIQVEWNSPSTASLGIEILDNSKKNTFYQSINSPNSPWSFFHLLNEGQEINKDTWSWNIHQTDGNTQKLAWEIRGEALELFKLNQNEGIL